MSNTRPNQCSRLLNYIEKNGSITSLTALTELGILRCGARISEIRNKKGIEIDDEWITVTNRFCEPCRVKRYFFPKEKE